MIYFSNAKIPSTSLMLVEGTFALRIIYCLNTADILCLSFFSRLNDCSNLCQNGIH